MRRLAGILLLAALVTACQEKLTAPADCPALCPGGSLDLRDTVVLADVGTTYPDTGGYVRRGLGVSLLVSNGLAAADARGVVSFLSRPDTVRVDDEWVSYAIDSVAITVPVQARDTLATGLALVLYRIPPAVAADTTSFVTIASYLTDANLIDTVAIADTLESGPIRLVLSDADLARVAIPAADDGVLAIAIALAAPEPTGVRIASIAAGFAPPTFVTYVTADVEDEDDQPQSITRGPSYASWVTAAEETVDFSRLVVGGAPSKRVILEFPFGPLLRDTAGIVRATLELTPTTPLIGLPNDPALIQARALFALFGAKSPTVQATNAFPAGSVVIEPPHPGIVSVDVTGLVRLWQAADSLPTALMLSLEPEAASFTRGVFESPTTGGAAAAPRLRITYSLPFEFEAP